jgi:hypothetical protein
MSEELATYSFLPWLRQGIANSIVNPADPTTVKLRASIPIKADITGTKPDGSAISPETIEQQIELYGPGDIIGIDAKAIVKTEPRNWITNFEPNYLPYIDFYEEDFPWRYTPAAPNGDRLKPWLTLVVLKEEELEDGKDVKDKPLPFFKLKEGSNVQEIFPKPSELWAWAHVHVNNDLSNNAAPNTANAAQVTQNITNTIKQNPDLAYSRIVCPRKLEANVGYYAFLIPTFESGRIAGLGRTIDPNLVATVIGWDNAANNEFPYYHRWYFRTGNVGDFEYLVNLLEPKPADKSVGVRDMDVLHIGSNLPNIDDPALAGILKLGGALRVPFDTLNDADKAEVKKYDEWDETPYPHEFSEAMASRINLADDYAHSTKTIEEINKDSGITTELDEGDPDPVITSPLYGRWHALQQRLLKDRNGVDLPHNKNWVHELNLDPRFRVSAGIGTKVVQKNQEEYMHAAWEQVGKIVEANNKIRFSQMAMEVSYRLYQQKLLPLIQDKSFVFTAPVHRRVVHQQLTVKAQVQESTVPVALTSGVFRSKTRPRGTLMKKLSFTSGVTPFNLINRVNEGKVQVAPPKQDPEGAIKLADLAKEVQPKNIPAFIAKLLKKYKWFKFSPLFLLLLVLVVVALFFPAALSAIRSGAFTTICIGLFLLLRKWENELAQAALVSQESQTPAAVDAYFKSPDFTLTQPGSDINPTYGNTDSAEAIRFKAALKDTFSLVETSFTEPQREKIDLSALNTAILNKINPSITIPARTLTTIKLPPRIRENMVETFAPVMAYPEIDVPMYKPLAELSSELFLPNLNKIEQNSITLLENNQKFIESYMVGINHEMSRELLWREFPTDQRGTYFRQFWDVNSFLPAQPPPADIKEQLRDIPPIHKWSKVNTSRLVPSDPNSVKKNELGGHNQRALTSGKTQLVLVVRGELLKKYPTAVVYAQKADWGADINAERELITLTASEQSNPPDTKLKTPLFEAKIDPDIYFFGFDLDDVEARGTENPQTTNDDPGWFFVLKERPGEPRFGLDIDKADRIINWNNLSWEDIGTQDGKCIELNNSITFTTYNNDVDQENRPNEDDIQARWNPNTNAAELAYILYQVPVMVAVHAAKMLPKNK